MCDMFEIERYVRNSFSVSFPRQLRIRRMANEFEDRLKGAYFQPQIISVPDDLDPEVPRIIFGSEHGFSEIIVTQMSVILNVVYSNDWQTNFEQRQAYLRERVPILFELTDILGVAHLHFCGLVSEVKLASHLDEQHVLNHLASRLLKQSELNNAHDIQVKMTNVIDEQFFNNVTIGNYRSWQVSEIPPSIVSLSRRDIVAHGIQIIHDFNDRYAFNEKARYSTNLDIGLEAIDRAMTEMRQIVHTIR
jgi:hypothetical protein